MNRIGFFKEDSVVIAEMHDVTQVNTEQARATFKGKDKTVYMTMHFMTPIDRDELEWLYQTLVDYKIIIMSDEEIQEDIDETIENVSGRCNYEFRCTSFEDAFDCAHYICNSPIYWEGRMVLEINDEPSHVMQKWLERKQKEKSE